MKLLKLKHLTLPIITATLSLAGCSQAQDAAPISAPITSAQGDTALAGNWTVITSESHLRFTATQQGHKFTGEFGEFDTLINFDPEHISDAFVTTTVDIASVSAGDKDRDGALPGKEWFFTKKFPKAVFQSNNFTKTGDTSYEAVGSLSMKGVSQPLTLPFSLNIENGIADMEGQLTLDRTLWEVGSGAWSTDEWVSTAVIIDVKIKAETK